MPEEFTKIEGLSIRYWSNVGGLVGDDGERRAVVLFHGNAFSLDTWKKTNTLEKLSSKGYRVFAIDLPAGKGSISDKLNPQTLKKDPERMNAILDRLFEAIGVGDAPFAIVGPSMGGGFALSYSLSRPKRVGALFLVSPSIYRITERERSRLPGLDMPVLLVWGDRDRVFPLDEYGMPLKESMPSAKLRVVKQAGHSAFSDKPDELNEILVDFLGEVLSPNKDARRDSKGSNSPAKRVRVRA